MLASAQTKVRFLTERHLEADRPLPATPSHSAEPSSPAKTVDGLHSERAQSGPRIAASTGKE